MFRCIAAVLMTLVSCSIASAQIIYEPVRYQYGDGDPYYYGGSDPSVIGHAEQLRALDLRGNTHELDGLNRAYLHSRLTGQLTRIFSDRIPYLNAAAYGFTVTDAANEAYENVPRYFRKGNLLAAAVVLSDGTRVVPAQAEPVCIERLAPAKAAPTSRGVILIIPKKNLLRSLPVRPSDKPVADAR